MELQKIAAELDVNGVALFAISYDSVATLKAFADKHGITYPLLADERGRVIRELGIRDDELDTHHAEFGRPVQDFQWGVAYPGIFLLNRNGVVTRKRFHGNYRTRDTGGGLLEAALGIASERHGAEQTAAGDEAVRVRAYVDTPAYRPYQRFLLVAELTVAPGYHVYAAPIPEGYVPLTVEAEPIEGLIAGEASWPAPHPFKVQGLDEDFRVLEGDVRGTLPHSLTKMDAGDQVITATIRYQACSETLCLRPAAVRVELPVSLAEAVQ